MSGLWKINQKRECESYGRALTATLTDLNHQPSDEADKAAHWYVVQTKYRVENRVTSELGAKGFHTFSPTREELHRWSVRSKRIHIPLFSGYAIVHTKLTLEARTSVLRTAGVLRFVEF